MFFHVTATYTTEELKLQTLCNSYFTYFFKEGVDTLFFYAKILLLIIKIMTKPKGGRFVGSKHFEFLASSGGKGRFSLTTHEAKKFVSMARPIVQCANWKTNVDRNIFEKIVKVIEYACYEADYECQGMPFTLPEETPPNNMVPMRAPDFGRGV